jgi:hypothetical protein
MIFRRKKTPSRQHNRRSRSRQALDRGARFDRSQSYAYRSVRAERQDKPERTAEQNQPRRRKKGRLELLLRSHAAFFVGLSLVIIIAIFMLSLGTAPKIVPLMSSSNAPFLRPTSVYQQAATKLFRQRLANRNKLTVNTEYVANKLQKEFPELTHVSVKIPVFGSRPIVYLQVARPALILKAKDGTFVIGEAGLALVKASHSTNLAAFHAPRVTDKSGLKIKLNQPALPSSYARFIRSVYQELHRSNVTVGHMVLAKDGYELNVYPKSTSYFVKFNLHKSSQPNAARAQAGTYLALRHRLAKQGEAPSHYVDVRIPGRVYYK